MTQNNTPLVSIIILNYNAGQLLIDCVDSVLQTNYSNFEIIVVDNASKDKSHQECKNKFSMIYLIENNQNFGYCEGNNVGIREAKGDFVVILNPDTLVDPDWLSELISAQNQNGDGLYQPKFLTTTDHNTLMSTGNMIQLFGFGFSRSKGQIDSHAFEKLEEIGYASGTCLFTSTKIIKDLEMFDSFLFAYHDDLDIGWRGALQGIKSYYVPKSIVYHPPEGFSFKWSSFKFYLLERNRLYCLLTHYSLLTIFKMLPTLSLVEIAVFFFYLKKGFLLQKIMASLNIIKNLNHIINRHKKIQMNRLISDREIIQNFTDNIQIPKEVNNKKSNQLLNNFLSFLSKITRKII